MLSQLANHFQFHLSVDSKYWCPSCFACVEPYEWDVCLPRNYDVQHSWHLNCCLHKNRFHGYSFEPLSTFWHHFCLYKWVSYNSSFYMAITRLSKIVALIGFAHLNLTVWLTTVFWCPCRKRIQQRLALYQGVCPIYMEFSDDAEETFGNALGLLQVRTWRKIYIVLQLR